MKAKVLLFIILLINASISVNECLAIDNENNELKGYDNSWNIIYIALDAIKLWNYHTQTEHILYERKNYSEAILPVIDFANTKLIFVRNSAGTGKGEIVFYDLNDKAEETILSTTSIWALSISPNKKLIAYLSDCNIDSETCKLFTLNLETKVIIELTQDIIKRKEYTWKIDWLKDSQHIVFSDSEGFVSIIDINTRKKEKVIKGYDPQVSPDQNKILCIQKNIINSSIPTIYDRISGQTDKIYISNVLSAIWSPSGEQLIFVRNDSNIFKYWDLGEYHREVVLCDLKSRESKTLFTYDAHSSNISVSVGIPGQIPAGGTGN